ncbi:MAG: MFS transporter [Defluviitaleaceae bacterium]|nr:MFS transporter [Defluviitaleaceae bacterium]
MKLVERAVAKVKIAARNFKSFRQTNPLTIRYGIDGILFPGAVAIASNNNNLFAQRLGADEFQLSMLQFLPHMLSLVLLVPMGLLADSVSNKRRLLSAALVLAGIFFAVAGGANFVPVYAVYFFLGFLALANVSVGIANLSWQSYFPEVVPENAWDEGVRESRNNILTFRARMTMIIQLVAPLTIGIILTSIVSDTGKLAAHQVFYVLAAVLLISNAVHFRKIKAVRPAEPKRISFAQMKTAARRLSKNKLFILFALVILFFHMTWHVDWTLYFIGQRNYLQMNEFLLGLTPVVAMIAQLVTLKRWSRKNSREGVERPLVWGILGLAIAPIAMIVGVSMPWQFVGVPIFLLLHATGMLAFSTVTLNIFQCLLKVVDEEYRSFSISVFIVLTTLSNAVMPVVGVAMYRGFGAAVGNARTGLIIAFAIVFVARIIAAGTWTLYVKYAAKVREQLGQS